MGTQFYVLQVKQSTRRHVSTTIAHAAGAISLMELLYL